MFHFTRTVNVMSGKFGEALAFAKDVNAHLAKAYDLNMQMAIPTAGNPNRICWMVDFETLADLEQFQSKAMGDTEYLQILKRAADIFISGSAFDEVWRTL